MAKRKLKAIIITPKKNRHHVLHQYESQPAIKPGSLSGGLGMDQPPDAEHTFASGDSQGLMQHLMQALALKGQSD